MNNSEVNDAITTKTTTTITVREAIRNALIDKMESDHSVFVMGEEVAEYNGAYKITQGLFEKFGPKRVIDTPITEYGFAGIGVGAAFMGLKPVVEFMTWNFGMQAIDHIINSAAKTCYMSGGQISCPIVFRGPNGAAARVGAQHSQCFASWYGHVPGLKVIAPYTAFDHYNLLKLAIDDPNPVIFLENELLYGRSFDIDHDMEPIKIGEARVIKCGRDITIIAFSLQVANVIEAAKELMDVNINVEIIDLCSIRPIDWKTIISSVKKTNRLMIVEEGWLFAGVGAEIAAFVAQEAFDYLDAEIIRIGAKDVPLPYAANLEKAALPCVAEIVDGCKKLIPAHKKHEFI